MRLEIVRASGDVEIFDNVSGVTGSTVRGSLRLIVAGGVRRPTPAVGYANWDDGDGAHD